MVFDVVYLGPVEIDAGGAQLGVESRDAQTVARAGGQPRPLRRPDRNPGQLLKRMRLRIAGDADVVRPLAVENRQDRLDRQPRPVLPPVEALLFHGRDELRAQYCSG